jgi:hypothetical protein
LPGLVDDAHAAAGDLLQQLIVAEIAHHPQHGARGLAESQGRFPRASRRGHSRRADTFSDPIKAILVAEERAQLIGQVPVPAEQVFTIRGVTEALRFQVIGENAVHLLLAFTGGVLVAHGSLAFLHQVA